MLVSFRLPLLNEEMDINDAAGIQALLEQLRSSQAWQEAVALPTAPNEPNIVPEPEESNSAPSASVAELLSQLRTEPDTSTLDRPSEPTPSLPKPTTPATPHLTPLTPTAPTADLSDLSRHLTFQQALPVIANLSGNPNLIQTLKSVRVLLTCLLELMFPSQMKDEQHALETRLMEERKAIVTKYEEKVKVAKTKASMIGSGMSKHEASMLSGAFHKELKSFDTERVLTAWDGLVSQQQDALSQLGIPIMFASTEPSHRESQQKVIQVLEGLL
ncbi:hypothetical protein D9757_000405 [Collybiopsis confluens]|uniref:Uncharacterized protein n=1 Tax=Collybiopsis confluens TaxID=2823264 RepID=A0A8H5MGI4_9AGAR|nr:hypothetical protein D9757_000405 [Collybiopsis confluens]